MTGDVRYIISAYYTATWPKQKKQLSTFYNFYDIRNQHSLVLIRREIVCQRMSTLLSNRVRWGRKIRPVFYLKKLIKKELIDVQVNGVFHSIEKSPGINHDDNLLLLFYVFYSDSWICLIDCIDY